MHSIRCFHSLPMFCDLCLLDALVSHAKMAELIEVPFGVSV